MVEVRLHGPLAKEFGKVWHFDISSPREAMQALCAMLKGFKRKVLELDSSGLVFRVRTKEHDYGEDDLELKLGSRNKRLDIIPIVRGASAGIRFIVGAVMVALAWPTGGATLGPGMQMLMGAGASLMLGAVVEWLTPVQKLNKQDSSGQSWTVSGPSNTVDAGVPVPIIYGEVLTGSHCISAGVAASQLTPSGSVAPSVQIGGETASLADFWHDHGASVTYQVDAIRTYSIGVFNLSDPLTVVWSYTGFSGATVQLTPNGRSVTAGYTFAALASADNDDQNLARSNSKQTVTGTINVSVTGTEYSATSGEPPKQTTVTASLPVTMTFTMSPDPGSSGH